MLSNFNKSLSMLRFKGNVGNCTSVGDMGIDENNNLWITTNDSQVLSYSGDGFDWITADNISSNGVNVTSGWDSLTISASAINGGYGNSISQIMMGPAECEMKLHQPPAPEGEMRVYDVDVVETHKKKTKILAENFDNACDIARNMYNEGNITFDKVDVDIG